MKFFLLFILLSNSCFAADKAINGVNSRTITNLYDFLLKNPKTGLITSSVDVKWQDGMRSVTTIERYEVDEEARGSQNRKFTIQSDEISEIGGTDTSPSPMEYLLHALGTSIIAAGNVKAILMGVNLNQFEVKIQTITDLHATLDIDARLRMGIKSFKTTITIGGDTTEANLRKIAQYGYDFSPIVDAVEKSFTKYPLPEIIVVKPPSPEKK